MLNKGFTGKQIKIFYSDIDGSQYSFSESIYKDGVDVTPPKKNITPYKTIYDNNSSTSTIEYSSNCTVKFESNSSKHLYITLEKDCFNCSIQNAEIIIYSKDNGVLETYKKKDESFITESFYISEYKYPVTINISYKLHKGLGTDKYITATVKMANPSTKLIIKPTD